MNPYVTKKAARAFSQMISRGTLAKAALIDAPTIGGLKISLMFSVEQPDAIMINAYPPVFVTSHTLERLHDSSIDFDEYENDFIIKLNNVIHTNA
jgi:hypothetical protein